jgi:Zn-dependent protease
VIGANSDLPLTRDARAIVDRAGEIAAQRGAPEASSTDVLRATLELQPGLVPKAHLDGSTNGAPGLPVGRLLTYAGREAQSMGHYQVSPVHLLLAMLYADTPSTSVPLEQAGLTLYGVRQRAQARPPAPTVRGRLGVSPVFLGIVGAAVASGALLWTGLAPGLALPLTLVFVVAGWIASLCIHEFGHALVAYLGGDRSVAGAGYLTLNPLRYTNATMSLVLPVLFLLLGGIALPGGAVYVNHSALRSKGWSSAVSLAGPLGTAVCWVLVAGVFTVAAQARGITLANLDFFGALAALAFFLAFALVLNLVPVPGLDGFGIIRPWLPYSLQYSAMRYGTVAIFGVFAALWFVAPIRDVFFNFVLSITAAVNIPSFLIGIGLHNMRLF